MRATKFKHLRAVDYSGLASIHLRRIVRHGRKNGVPVANILLAYGLLVRRGER